MGNRAIVKPVDMNIGVYLHWNGGPKSVEAFLTYCELKKYRSFGGPNADGYGIARFCQVVGNFFGGGLSMGIKAIPPDVEKFASELWLDNGVYEVSDWKVVKHYGSGPYPEDYDIKEMMLSIDKAQPEKERLGEDYILADIMDPKTLNIGDKVMIYDSESGKGVEVHEVVGFGKEGIYTGYPYTNHYGNPETYKKNPNNYIFEPVRIADPNTSLTWH